MMYSTVSVTVLLMATLTGGQPIDDATLSGVSQLLSSAPYPSAAQPHAQYWDQQPARLPQGFTVQSGYEGIIAPAEPDHDGPSTFQKLGGAALGAGLLTHLLPFPFNKILLVLGSKLGLFVLSVIMLVLVGGAATTAVCALTPICTISFLGLRLNRESVRSFFSQDRLDSITEFVHDAIEKYQKLQARHGKKFVKKSENKGKKPKYAKVNQEEVKENEKKEAREAKDAEIGTTEISREEKKEIKEVTDIERNTEINGEEKKEVKEVTDVEPNMEVSREGRELNEKDVKESNEVPKEETQQ